ncbi:MAG: 1-(5-phosphoribosyl)-5-amino-4-imidazole-carboxylate carboxylase [Rickettsiales bacterium]|nr:1-(5-phosphoribosyl)-5-amino-4-imidazole-carboxylate carboxylase [Rickettsiales bacterium]
MERNVLIQLLEAVRAGETSTADALRELERPPIEDRGYAQVDVHRAVRLGLPEVIFGAGKTAEQIEGIAGALLDRGQRVLVTRLAPESAPRLLKAFPDACHHEQARCLTIEVPGRMAADPCGDVLIVSAGTSDIPVAEEARVCAEAFGNRVELVVDVGVAGLHRILAQRDRLAEARVVIVVAGMEGALTSVVGGLVACPVIGVPTSIGYGASFDGLAALLGMLNSCSAGVTVVNIDNGFGAAYAATLINRGDGFR